MAALLTALGAWKNKDPKSPQYTSTILAELYETNQNNETSFYVSLFYKNVTGNDTAVPLKLDRKWRYVCYPFVLCALKSSFQGGLELKIKQLHIIHLYFTATKYLLYILTFLMFFLFKVLITIYSNITNISKSN